MGSRDTDQTKLFPKSGAAVINNNTGTFVDNLSLPIHRWFRFPAGFSAAWVKEVILREKKNGREHVLDPFSGSGTVVVESEFNDVEGKGVEAHPFLARIARTKLYWKENPSTFSDYASHILEEAKEADSNTDRYPDLIQRCYPQNVLLKLDSLRRSWERSADTSPQSELVWLAIASILRPCSPVGTANWQYILPNKSKARTSDPYEAFSQKITLMCNDMKKCQGKPLKVKSKIYNEDIRKPSSIPQNWAELVITSPPYANNYDYADATRLEMTFFGDIQSWGDLQHVVRPHLIRACTQHVAKIKNQTFDILEEPQLNPIYDEIIEVCRKLDLEKDQHAGKKPYHTMVATYFYDMALMWANLRKITTDDALICFVIGDSAPYGIYVPVDRWLGELALSVGFKSFEFEVLRDRNVKWRNRKHRVPLHEGRLWIQG